MLRLLNPLDGLTGFYRPDDFTIAGLLTKRRNGALGGVLGDIDRAGGVGILVVKDFSTVLAQGPTHRAGMFSMLRRLYDGEVERALGSDGGTQLHFKGKVGLLGATTDAIDQVSDEIGDLGPRMLLYRMPDIDEDAAMLAAARNTGNQTTMRADLADAVGSFLTGLDVSVWPLRPQPDIPELRALAQWAVWCRSPVLRDDWGEIEHVPRREAGMRVYANLLQLTAGAITIGLDDITAERLVRQVALDSIPAMRRSVLETIRTRSMPTTRTLADALGLPDSVVGRVCQDPAALGILVRNARAVGNEPHWPMSETARELIQSAELQAIEVSP